MARSHPTQANLKKESQQAQLEKELGYSFSDASLLVRALTHVSYDHEKSAGHNEVLEFLGDAVLDLAISDLLIRSFPEKSEGDLSRMRAALVNSTVLPEKAALLNLGPLLRLGKGEERSGGRDKPSILAGAFEALLGAVYRDGGYEAARRLVERHFAADVKEKNLGQQDYKTRLQEISQMLFHGPPSYRLPRAVPTMTSASLQKCRRWQNTAKKGRTKTGRAKPQKQSYTNYNKPAPQSP
jgi:ribonuclease III